ncbi:MAG TPA: TRAP transporter small permease subunit [Beijerinckiaceae bacterium]|nr:TRAP transporter small permease subunit [Beijerinckiaceae bacterium]
MHRFLLIVDGISAAVGKAFGWCILILTLAIAYEVGARYVFRAPTDWAFDVSYMLYGALFMMAGAYTLARNGHVRGDFIYRYWPAKAQATVDLVLFFLFFFPGILALIYAGYNFAWLSWMLNERSAFSPRGPVVWPFKMLIPIAGFFMLLQGIAEVLRCITCIRTGVWPPRLHDVEELEKVAAEEAMLKARAERGHP